MTLFALTSLYYSPHLRFLTTVRYQNNIHNYVEINAKLHCSLGHVKFIIFNIKTKTLPCDRKWKCRNSKCTQCSKLRANKAAEALWFQITKPQCVPNGNGNGSAFKIDTKALYPHALRDAMRCVASNVMRHIAQRSTHVETTHNVY